MHVLHDKDNQTFYVEIEGQKSVLNYREESPGVLNYFRTYTPESLRGQGLAGQVTRAALEYAAKENLKVFPGCPYVLNYIEKHPEFKPLLPVN